MTSLPYNGNLPPGSTDRDTGAEETFECEECGRQTRYRICKRCRRKQKDEDEN